MRCDVVVIGAGPAGLFAALCLLRQGFQVAVLEEHEVVGVPADCSGVVGVDAFGVLGFDGFTVLGEVRQLALFSPGGIRVDFTAAASLASVVDRARFDQRLAAEVTAASGILRTGWHVTNVGVEADGVVVRRAGGAEPTVRARLAILACGPRYHLQKALGLGTPGAFLHTAQVEVEARDLPCAQVHFGSAVAPGSFAWAVPFWRDGRALARVGVSSTGPAEAPLSALLGRLRDDGRVGEDVSPPRRWPIPILPLARTYADRVLVVGDAAGQAKATSGGGIYYSLLCARMAAETAARAMAAGDLSARFLGRYERAWRQQIGLELRAGRLFRFLFERLEDSEIDEVFRIIASDGILPTLSQKVRFDWHAETIRCVLRHPAIAGVFLRGFFR